MGKIRRVMRCYCCGAVLQSKKKDEIGYIGKAALEGADGGNILYCNSCYQKMRVINAGLLDMDTDEEILKVIE